MNKPAGTLSYKEYNRNNRWRQAKKNILKNWQLYIFILPAFLYFLIFAYVPMYGIQMAFKDFSPKLGITGSPWADPWYKHFLSFISAWNFKDIMLNTFTLALYRLVATFPIPIILALLINEVKNLKFKKLVQNVTYAPYFISMVVLVGMMDLLFAQNGIINQLIVMLGGESFNFLMNPSAFKHMYVWSDVWQKTGYSAVIYIAALAGVPNELHEAAMMDGASRLKRIWHINIPHILPTIIILLIMECGAVMNIGFEKIFLMQNDVNAMASEVISTYTYKLGILQRNYGLSAAVGLFNNLINLVLLLTVNTAARKVSDTSLF
ncbi:ABC transporter permease subunit [Ruminococcaceae bacterium OttesenSCG-928-A11]|nr:ABC transporter permease subunit [Ruminococcaceae bacterium OttesenSCG-928-A11]